ncbi:MAG TPA: hypothetical protein VKV23_03355 [Acidimicrobiales bacterium]|nr:hypothetical protein [Acidimicrobiales bacterium]
MDGGGRARRLRLLPAVLAVVARPDLWPTALRLVASLAPDGWWRRAPFLPVPDRRWLAFRLTTAYGAPDATPRPADVVEHLAWLREERRLLAAYRRWRRWSR